MNELSYPIRSAFLSNKSFSIFLVSTIMALLATTLGVVVDGIIVGHLLGTSCFAAVNIVAPVLQIYNSLHLIPDQCSSIMIGNAIGKRDKTGAQKIFSTALSLNLMIGFSLVILGNIFMQPILQVLCPNIELQPLVKDYLQVVIWSSPLYLLLPGMCFFTRSDGNPGISTVALIVANVINLVLDIVFIKYLGWGLRGSALASSIGFSCGILVTCSHFFRKERIIAFIKPAFKKYAKPIVLDSIPFVLTMLVMSVCLMLGNIIIIKFVGNEGIVTMSVCYNIFSFLLLINMGNNQTILPLMGILKGMGDQRGVNFIVKRAFRIFLILTGIYLAIIFIFPKTVIGMFGIDDISVDMVRHVRIYAIGLIGFAVNFFFTVIYLGTKRNNLTYYMVLSKDSLPILFIFLFCLLGFPQQLWWSYILGNVIIFFLLNLFSRKIQSKNKDLLPLFLINKPTQDTDNFFNFSVPAKLDGLRDALTTIRHKVDQHPDISTRQAFVTDLCCEEIISNIIEHGYKRHPEKHMIDIFITILPDETTICIHDDGKPFNPIKYQNDTTIGLLLINKLCYSTDYIFSMNQNIMTIVVKKGR